MSEYPRASDFELTIDGGTLFMHESAADLPAGSGNSPPPQAVSPTGWSQTSSVPVTGISLYDGLFGGSKWGGAVKTGAVVEYSFPGSAGTPVWEAGYGKGEPLSGLRYLNATQQAVIRSALQEWADVANIRFVPVADTATNVGDIRFAFTNNSPTAHAYLPGAYAEAGDVWFGNSRFAGSTFTPGTYAYATAIHEIGHAIGLKHPHEGTKHCCQRISVVLGIGWPTRRGGVWTSARSRFPSRRSIAHPSR